MPDRLERLTDRFTSRQAPCGQVVAGEIHQDRDEQTITTADVRFACGCRTLAHEYHDGTVTRRVVHHSGRIIEDDVSAAEHVPHHPGWQWQP